MTEEKRECPITGNEVEYHNGLTHGDGPGFRFKHGSTSLYLSERAYMCMMQGYCLDDESEIVPFDKDCVQRVVRSEIWRSDKLLGLPIVLLTNKCTEAITDDFHFGRYDLKYFRVLTIEGVEQYGKTLNLKAKAIQTAYNLFQHVEQKGGIPQLPYLHGNSEGYYEFRLKKHPSVSENGLTYAVKNHEGPSVFEYLRDNGLINNPKFNESGGIKLTPKGIEVAETVVPYPGWTTDTPLESHEYRQWLHLTGSPLIEKLLPIEESGTFERKEFPALDQSEKGKLNPFLRAVASFLNSDGGAIVLGISDDGRLVGFGEDEDLQKLGPDKLQRKIRAKIDSKISPSPLDKVDVRVEIDGEICVVLVVIEPALVPSFYDNNLIIRDGNGTRILNSQEITDFILKRTTLQAGGHSA